MSGVSVVPELMSTAAGDLATIGSDLGAAHQAAALPTTGLIPAAADEVSAGVAHLFSQYGSAFQALAGKAAAFHDQFVTTLKTGATAYAHTEAASASFLQSLPSGLQSILGGLEDAIGGVLAAPLIVLIIGIVILAALIAEIQFLLFGN